MIFLVFLSFYIEASRRIVVLLVFLRKGWPKKIKKCMNKPTVVTQLWHIVKVHSYTLCSVIWHVAVILWLTLMCKNWPQSNMTQLTVSRFSHSRPSSCSLLSKVFSSNIYYSKRWEFSGKMSLLYRKWWVSCFSLSFGCGTTAYWAGAVISILNSPEDLCIRLLGASPLLDSCETLLAITWKQRWCRTPPLLLSHTGCTVSRGAVESSARTSTNVP